MTPLEIQIILHIYAVAEPIRGEHFPSQQAALAKFKDLGLIRACAGRAGGYCLTEKGEELVARLKSTSITPSSVEGKAPIQAEEKRPFLLDKFLITGGDTIAPKPCIPHESMGAAVRRATDMLHNSEFFNDDKKEAIIWAPVRIVRRKRSPVEVIDVVVPH